MKTLDELNINFEREALWEKFKKENPDDYFDKREWNMNCYSPAYKYKWVKAGQACK
jgi:hypothetical protein